MYNQHSTIFNQILQFVPFNYFEKIVGQHNADKYIKKFTTWQLFIVLLYSQITGKDSLREIESGFKCQEEKRYHLGLKSCYRNTISNAINNRSYEIFEYLFYKILESCKICSSNKLQFENPLYSLDASVIDLCLNIFDWAKFRKEKGAIKLHVLLNNTSNIPELINIIEGKCHEINHAKTITDKLVKGSIITFDRGYFDYKWFDDLYNKGIIFVTRTKKTFDFITITEFKINEEGIICDKEVEIFNPLSSAKGKYPRNLRLIRYYDKIHNVEYEFITNNFEFSAKTIADIYKSRWDVELFFKRIKQNLKIKTFLGTSKNAVMIQIWIAMIYYLILAFINQKVKTNRSLLELTRCIKEVIMKVAPLISILGLSNSSINNITNKGSPGQLSLF